MTEPILAWRHWHIRPNDAELRSVAQPLTWRPGVPLVAECLKVVHQQKSQGATVTLTIGLANTSSIAQAEVAFHARAHAEPAPYWPCTCGIHAWKIREACLAYAHRCGPFGHGPRFVYGRVLLAGHRIHHTHGYRAAWAQIYDLFIPTHVADEYPDLAHRLRQAYAVDAEVA